MRRLPPSIQDPTRARLAATALPGMAAQIACCIAPLTSIPHRSAPLLASPPASCPSHPSTSRLCPFHPRADATAPRHPFPR
ncbi:hypothetical protein E2562_015557 [Oryza meyeriana var. granulata]|uniref:Uncharacterized protein n=1 Tax=Oryza meyeriana var. granulata TaxID=110450 RepID=A0A6G1CG85_9ORYZ|nr:hypothetical protein E2562_015557 [Oryza meyeriana var. granulata]